MKIIILSLIFLLLPSFVFGQQETRAGDVDSSYLDLINIDKLNGTSVLSSDSFNNLVERRLKESKIITDEYKSHHTLYFTNTLGTKYLKIFGGPDLGYRWYYSIGYTKVGKCKECGIFLGRLDMPDFIVNGGIKLGDNFELVWKMANLVYFRKFNFKDIEYFYFEKGIANEIPFRPNQIFYYKFKNKKLIEIGFGHGMHGINPIFIRNKLGYNWYQSFD